MFRKLAAVVMLLAPVAPAGANLLANGDFSAGEAGWTRWAAPWGASNYAVTNLGLTPPEGTLSLNQGQNGSFGWFQVVPVPAGQHVVLDAKWKGDIGGAGWAEVMLWTTADPTEDAGHRADTGNAADIAFKKDSWGMNPPTVWDWQAALLSKSPTGNSGAVDSQGLVVVALKLGSVSGSPVTASIDSVSLVPEPAGSLLLGLIVLPLLRRSRQISRL